MSPEYIAGFFDGEGTATITITEDSSPYGFSWRPKITIAQKNREVLDLIRKYFGGGIVLGPHKDGVHTLRLDRKDVLRSFLELISQHSVVKFRQLTLIREALLLKHGSGNPTSRDEALRVIGIISELRELTLRKRPYRLDLGRLRQRVMDSPFGRNVEKWQIGGE